MFVMNAAFGEWRAPGERYSAETTSTLGGPGVPSVTVVPRIICKF